MKTASAIKNNTLVVDLDGTLTRTDTLIESILLLIKKSPLIVFYLPLWLIRGRLFFKNKIAERISLNVETLPYNENLIAFLKDQKLAGRKLVLATAAHESIATKVSNYLGLFDDVISSDETTNVKGETKLSEIRNKYGDKFSYAGDSSIDLPIWKSAQSAILVNVNKKVRDSILPSVQIEKEFSNSFNLFRTWIKALRVHQWIKNLLIFVPLLTAFNFTDTEKIVTSTLGFLSFSLVASGTYIFNDLWDLTADRLHPKKRKRPFASAKIPIPVGTLVALFIISSGLLLSFLVSKGFCLILLFYLALTKTYSIRLKKYVLVDVIMLAFLYTLRIIAGSIAINVTTSAWLLAFSIFIFMSLALIKRCSELVVLKQNSIETTQGRDYSVNDLVILWPLGIGAGFSSIIFFSLFISTPETLHKYQTPELLWLVSAGLIYWLSKMWIKTARGEMHDDPIIFAITNRESLFTIIVMVIIVIIAHFYSISSII